VVSRETERRESHRIGDEKTWSSFNHLASPRRHTGSRMAGAVLRRRVTDWFHARNEYRCLMHRDTLEWSVGRQSVASPTESETRSDWQQDGRRCAPPPRDGLVPRLDPVRRPARLGPPSLSPLSRNEYRCLMHRDTLEWSVGRQSVASPTESGRFQEGPCLRILRKDPCRELPPCDNNQEEWYSILDPTRRDSDEHNGAPEPRRGALPLLQQRNPTP
jgi:hypothetical protein